MVHLLLRCLSCLPLAGSAAPSLPPFPSSVQRSGISEPGPSIANDAQPAPSNVTGGNSLSGFQSARSFGGAVASASRSGGQGSRRGPAGRRISLPFSQGVRTTASCMHAAQHRETSCYIQKQYTIRCAKVSCKSTIFDLWYLLKFLLCAAGTFLGSLGR